MVAECCDARNQRQYFGKYNHELKGDSLRELIDCEISGKLLRSFYNNSSMA